MVAHLEQIGIEASRDEELAARMQVAREEGGGSSPMQPDGQAVVVDVRCRAACGRVGRVKDVQRERAEVDCGALGDDLDGDVRREERLPEFRIIDFQRGGGD